MIRLILPLALICLALQCDTQNAGPEPNPTGQPCGVNNPARSLPWLKDIITKAEEDKATMAHKGNYFGTIYLESLRNEPIFLVQMMMWSGGIAFYLFRCDGERVYPTADEMSSVIAGYEKKNVVYTNVPQ
ncbi:MAG: hypothetical protein EOP06_03675 [Proteobacteria bacterium]|nr:MAG: hypothetical protein EOP06_03675 [Pseudomonadota bacterium]